MSTSFIVTARRSSIPPRTARTRGAPSARRRSRRRRRGWNARTGRGAGSWSRCAGAGGRGAMTMLSCSPWPYWSKRHAPTNADVGREARPTIRSSQSGVIRTVSLLSVTRSRRSNVDAAIDDLGVVERPRTGHDAVLGGGEVLEGLRLDRVVVQDDDVVVGHTSTCSRGVDALAHEVDAVPRRDDDVDRGCGVGGSSFQSSDPGQRPGSHGARSTRGGPAPARRLRTCRRRCASRLEGDVRARRVERTRPRGGTGVRLRSVAGTGRARRPNRRRGEAADPSQRRDAHQRRPSDDVVAEQRVRSDGRGS
jgi:hypothetical protein